MFFSLFCFIWLHNKTTVLDDFGLKFKETLRKTVNTIFSELKATVNQYDKGSFKTIKFR